MAFDAGSITASLTLDTSKFDADLQRARAKLADLTKDHKIKVSAVFDTASLSKARKMFADLDNMISRDAAQRLKSSPQGSVLGALNSLFSPHPVTGAPSPQSSSQSGLLGKMVSGQGGGGPAGAAGNAGSGGRNTSSTNAVRDLLTGPQPGNTSTTDQIKQVLTGQGAQDAQTTDRIKQVLTGTAPGNVSTEDVIKRVVTGAAPGNISTTDTIKEKIDPASKDEVIADSADSGAKSGDAFGRTFNRNAKGQFASAADGTEKDAADTGDKSGSGFAVTFTRHISDMLTGFKKNMGSAGSSGGADMAKGILGGIGPGILGIPVKSMLSKWAAGLTVGLAALPALAGVIGLGIGTALIGGAVAAAIKTSPALKAQFAVIGKDASSMFTNAAAPLIPAVSAVLKQVPALLKTIGPQLTDVFKAVAPQIQGIFSGLKPIISGVLGIMKAAAPAFGTLIEGLEKLVSGILPGIETVIKAAVPFAAQFAGILGTLGKDLGSFFADAAPAIGASMQVLGALLDLIGGLLPVVMKLAGVFATALAPVIGVFATAIKALTPFLTTLGVILAELAQAVLGDLGSAFTALAALLVGIAPSLNTLATALGSVFSTLENTGVFAEIGNAIEALAPPLAKLINALVQGLAPALPTIVSLLGKMAAVVTAGAVIILGGLASALTSIVKAVPPGVLQAIAIGLVAVFTAFKVGSLISSAATAIGGVAKAMLGLDASMDANPIGLVVLAIAALGTAFYIAWEKSAGFRNIMKDIAAGFLEYGQIIVEIDRDIVNAFLEVVANILSAAATAFGWVPGLGSKLREASTNFDNFKGHVNNTFNGMISTMQGWQSDLDTDTSKGAASLKTVEDAFDSQSKAAGDAKTALDNYTTSVTDNGVKSAAAQAARTQLITDLTDAGVKSSTAQTDVGNYTAAITQNGVSSTQAQAARQQLITDVLNASNNAKQGNTDLGNYTTAVRNNGTDSDAAKAARQQLITDLENAGMNAKTATGLVNDLGNGIKGLPGGKNINIDVTAQGTWTVTGLQALLGMNTSAGGLKPTPTGAASGGIVSGTGDGDNQLYLLESGEVIVPRKLRQTGFFSKVIAPWLKKMGVPGFAAGGVASTWVDNDYDSTEDNAATSMKSQFLAALKGASAAATSAAAAGSTKTGAGDMTYAQLEALWIQAGGSPAVASNMAKIAIAESGGNPNAYNASGATGLWQILGAVVSGNLYSPLVNAENAVSKYNAGGYAPWESDPVAAGLLGMAQGGMITEPVIGFGASGQRYMFGERGTETVTPGGGASIADVCARLERLIATTAAVPAGVGSHMGSAIGGAAAAASLRQRYPRGGS